MAAGLAEYCPRLRGADFATIADDALNVIEPLIFADAIANAATHGLKPDEIRVVEKIGEGGHREREYAGGERAHFSREFRPPLRFARLRSQSEYKSMARDSALRNIGEIARRPPLNAPRAAF